MTYVPPFFPGQLDGSQFQGVNCSAWSASKAAAYHTLGAVQPTSPQVRQWTGDKVGGLNLAQVDYALRTHTSVDLDVQYRYPWASFVARIKAGQAAVLQGWYGPIADTRFDAGNGFRGNHAILVLPGFVVMDPLADGRRPGIYRFHGEAYPQALLLDFAGRLNIGGGSYRPLGAGLVYAAFTRDNERSYRVVIKAGKYGVYTVSGNTVTKSRVATTGGFSASCSAPRLYPWPGHTSQSLVLLTSGSHKGQWVRSSYAVTTP
jgi:hypothetical protein